MTHEELSDFNADENQEFAEVIGTTFADKDIEALEVLAEEEAFSLDVVRVASKLNEVCDFFAARYDQYVVAAALEILHNEWDGVTDRED